MKKRIIYLFTSAIVSLFILASAYSQEDMTVVGNSPFDNPQRVSSLFKHDEHNEAAGVEDCSECHHVYKDGKKVEDESSEDTSCSDCHGNEASGNTPALMKAFHTNCKGCHLELGKGPIMCGECHKK
jgi:cytochrome c553